MTEIDLNNKTIIVTGAAGFIGSNLVKRLISDFEGVRVIGIDNMNDYYDVRLKEFRLGEIDELIKNKPSCSFEFIKDTIADKAVIDSLFEKKINWEHVDDKLGILREQSNNYLDGLLL